MKRKQYTLESFEALKLVAHVDETDSSISYTCDPAALLKLGPEVLFPFTKITLHTELIGKSYVRLPPYTFRSEHMRGFTCTELLDCVMKTDKAQRALSSAFGDSTHMDDVHVFFEGFSCMTNSQACASFRMIWGS